MSFSDRAVTPEQKREVVEALLDAWLSQPSLRLGQLIVAALRCHAPDVFYTEDYALIAYLKEAEKRYREIDE